MELTGQAVLADLQKRGFRLSGNLHSDRLRAVHMCLLTQARKRYGLPRLQDEHRKWLDAAGLPSDLIELLSTGRLVTEVERSRAWLARLNARLDAFEHRHPAEAMKAPWRAARDAWRAAGCPELPWWELLRLTRSTRR